MVRYKFWFGLALFMALLIGSMSLAQAATTGGVPTKPSPPIIQPASGRAGQPTLQGSPSYVTGAPAIPVHTALGVTANKASTPAFTEDDVIAFLNKYGFYAGPLAQGAHLKVLLFEFVSAKQASVLMSGESVGRPDTDLVCYVRVKGPFIPKAIHAPSDSRIPKTVEFGDMVFDAHTGNNLVWGAWG